jgi:60S ribosome subunit biogenesis protein NIP7
VYYVSERVMRQATSVARDDLVALGTCFGKFTKTKKFHLKVTALDFVAQHAKVSAGAGWAWTAPEGRHRGRRLHTPLRSLCRAQYKVWVKPSSEMSFLYGNHVLKAGIARMTEAIPQYAGVVVLSMAGIPLGFGRAAHTTEQCKGLEPNAIAVLHQVDVGEYLRAEDELS